MPAVGTLDTQNQLGSDDCDSSAEGGRSAREEIVPHILRLNSTSELRPEPVREIEALPNIHVVVPDFANRLALLCAQEIEKVLRESAAADSQIPGVLFAAVDSQKGHARDVRPNCTLQENFPQGIEAIDRGNV